MSKAWRHRAGRCARWERVAAQVWSAGDVKTWKAGHGIRSHGQAFDHVAVWRGRAQLLRANWQEQVGMERPAGRM